MKVIVFDTETNGLFPKTQEDKWPYIVQFSYAVYDTVARRVVEEYDTIVRIPEDVDIPDVCVKIHGITKEMSLKSGVSMTTVLQTFHAALQECDRVIAHNIAFDRTMLKLECKRNHVDIIDISAREYCTMARGRYMCNIPYITATGYHIIKSPKLCELHDFLFGVGSTPKNTHNSRIDTAVCLRCYVKMEHGTDLCDTDARFKHAYYTPTPSHHNNIHIIDNDNDDDAMVYPYLDPDYDEIADLYIDDQHLVLALPVGK